METPPLQKMMPHALDEGGARKRIRAIIYTALALFALVAGALAIEYRRGSETVVASAQTAAAASVKNYFADVSLAAESAIVYDIKNNKILYAHNADAQLPLASITKVPLAIVVSEVFEPDFVMSIPRDAYSSVSVEKLGKGERWSVKNITDFTLVASSNAGAEILAEAAEKAIRSRYPDIPEESAALWRMNELAKELGLESTYFLNTSGLDISENLSGAYGSARDVAELFGFAASWYRTVFNATAQNGVVLASTDGSRKLTVYNTNVAIGDFPGLIMGKTGITDLAGGNLAVVFEVAPAHPIAAVVLGSTRDGRFDDMKILAERTRRAVADIK